MIPDPLWIVFLPTCLLLLLGYLERMHSNSDWLAASCPAVPSFILAKMDEVERICAEVQVSKMWLFGSALRKDFDSRESDLDFLVEFTSPDAPGISDRYFFLAENLERLFQRPVDLITIRSIRNPVFVEQVKASIRQLYAA